MSAPWLIVGFVLAGLIHTLMPESLLQRLLSGGKRRSVLLATLIGIPLPLCSCSVIPVALSLRRKGASRGATTSFLISTPEIGIDSFLLSYTILSPLFAVLRLVSTFISAMLVGNIVETLSISKIESQNDPNVSPSTKACCCAKQPSPETKSCCKSADSDPSKTDSGSSRSSFVARGISALSYGFGTIAGDLSAVLSLGLTVAGLAAWAIPDNFFGTLDIAPTLQMLVMLIAAFPVYVCSVSATPLALALLSKGVASGAVLVFLLVGPASNITTMLAVYREFGSRVLAIYLSGIIIVSVSVASIIDTYLPATSHTSLNSQLDHVHQLSSVETFSGLILIAVLAYHLSKGLRGKLTKRTLTGL